MTALRTDVSALYVDPRGPYPKLLADCWDESRDARLYAGPNPVVAHPPCGPWGRLKHLCTRQSAEHAPLAVALVRRWGGALEHPAWSGIFSALLMPRPGELPDAWGGRTYAVNQVDFGHPARKPTWIYVVGAAPGPTPPRREPTHWVSGGRSKRRKGYGGRRPAHILACSAQQRRRTPVAFAEWLIDLASRARPA